MMTLTDAMRRMVPRTIKAQVRAAREYLHKRMLFGRLANLVPPEELMHDGPPTYEAYKQNADEFYRIYLDLCRLRHDERMLDVGCGIGRKAIRLTHFLTPPGSYDGIDIVPSGIEWLKRTITSRYPHFRFQLIDVYNQHYNPRGRGQAATYRFPFPSASFDFVTLGSVFTHMRPRDTENYLSEIRRVLKPGGRCLISWFLLNAESLDLVSANRSTQAFNHPIEGVCRTVSLSDPEVAIAYDETYVRQQYQKRSFAIEGGVHCGSWCGRSQFLSYQDLILARVCDRN